MTMFARCAAAIITVQGLAGLAGMTAVAAPPRIGDEAPPLRIAEVIQAPDGTDLSWDALRGNVVLVEFWATWCAPCVAAIPHLNNLTEEFEAQSVRFIAISAEKPETVKKLLAKRPMKPWVVLDEATSTFDAYQVRLIPYTVIVDPQGKIAAITSPSSVTPEVIRNVLEGRPAGLPEPKQDASSLEAGADPDENAEAKFEGDAQAPPPPLFQVVIRPSAQQGNTSCGGGRYTAKGVKIADVLPTAYGLLTPRIEGLDQLDQGTYTVVVRAPDAVAQAARDEMMRSLLRSSLEATFGFSAERQQREVDAYALMVAGNGSHKLKAAVETSQSTRTGGGVIEVTNGRLGTLASALEAVVGLPILDETGLTERFDYRLDYESSFDSADPPMPSATKAEELTRALREQLGLELTPVRRTIEVLVLEPKTRLVSD